MKNIFKLIILLAVVLVLFACPKKDTTKPPTVYTNNIDVRFAGSWDLYSCQEDTGAKSYYPVLMQKDYLIASSDSLLINSELIGGTDNHGVTFYDGQIYYVDKNDSTMYLYDYYFNKDLNRIWLKEDTSPDLSFDYDPMLNPQDTTVTVNDFKLLYPSTQPPAPILDSPENNSEIGELKPNLSWASYAGATEYNVQVSTDSLFENADAIVVDATTSQSNYNLPSNLNNFTRYYWRVKADNSVWSATYAFDVFYIVSLTKPENGESASRKPLMKWEAYDGADSYVLQISLVSDFSNVLIEETLNDNQYIPNTILEPQKRYYWRVKANNSEGNWSLTNSFITDAYILLQSPINGFTGVDVSNIDFSWQSIENAEIYHIQIADSLTEDDELVNIIIDVDDLNTTSYNSSNELQENKTYYWRVTSDVSGKWSYVFNFVTNTSVFLREPENGAIQVPTIVKFDWDELTADDDIYTIQISTDNTFAEAYQDTSSFTEKIVYDYLQPDTEYFWRVKVDDGDWSDVWSFTTMDVTSGTNPTLPVDGAAGVYQKPTFGWDTVINANYYEIIVANDENYESVVIDTVITAESYVMSQTLIFGNTYYWKVKSDRTLWSATSSFTVESGIPENLMVVSTSPMKFDISWINKALKPTGYVLERWDSESGEWVVIADVDNLSENSVDSYVDFDKDPNVSYKYRIKAVSSSGDSEYATYPDDGSTVSPMNFESDNFPEMVNVQAGSFDMGSTAGDDDEEPIHSVTLTHDFMMSKYEISVSQFVDVLNYALGKGYIKNSAQYTGQFYTQSFYNYASNAVPISNLLLDSTPIDFDMETHKFIYTDSAANLPIYDVTYFSAALYCYTLNDIEGNDLFYTFGFNSVSSDPYNGSGYRLPTEAEWEYVAQYNDGRTYPWGNTDPDKDHANYYGSGWGNEPLDIDACSAGVNELGIYNMAGNVWEWCNDTYEAYSQDSVTDPTGPAGNTTTATYKIIRGSSCEFGPDYLRNQNRSYCKANLDAGKVNSKIGFRIIKLQ